MRALLLTLLAILVFCVPACGGRRSQAKPPRLIVAIIIDQGGSEVIDRYSSDLRGGIRWIIDNGARFVNASHYHVPTSTAPGHATLFTGSAPKHHGIVDNEWFSRERNRFVRASEDPEYGASPNQLLSSGLADWLKLSYSGAKVYAVAGKERSAVMMAGKRGDAAFWYDSASGEMRSSRWYKGGTPAWLSRFTENHSARDFFARSWDAHEHTAALIEKHRARYPDLGKFSGSLPRTLGPAAFAPDREFYGAINQSPFLDKLTLALAHEILIREKLGQDDSPDLLAVSLSALDVVGHRFGPGSPEFLDVLVRADIELGEFLNRIFTAVPKESVLIGFSADHGVLPMPEMSEDDPRGVTREGMKEVLCLQNVYSALTEKFGRVNFLSAEGYLNNAALAKAEISKSELAGFIKNRVEACAPAVAKSYLAEELAADAGLSPTDPYLGHYREGYFSGRSPDIYIRWREFHLPYQGIGTNHGSPYSYDSRVPLVFAGYDIAPAVVDASVATKVFAPTLARLAGVYIDSETASPPLTITRLATAQGAQ